MSDVDPCLRGLSELDAGRQHALATRRTLLTHLVDIVQHRAKSLPTALLQVTHCLTRFHGPRTEKCF